MPLSSCTYIYNCKLRELSSNYVFTEFQHKHNIAGSVYGSATVVERMKPLRYPRKHRHSALQTLSRSALKRFGQCFSESKFFKQNSTIATRLSKRKKNYNFKNNPSMLNQPFCISTKIDEDGVIGFPEGMSIFIW